MSKTPAIIKRIKGWYIAVFIVLCAGGLIYGFHGRIYAQMNAWKLIPLPEHFTELYFANYPRVPQNTTPGKRIAFQFTVHNVEGQTQTYHYRVEFRSSNGRTKIIDIGTVTLPDGAAHITSESYTFTAPNERGAIAVDLIQPSQEIRFLVTDQPN